MDISELPSLDELSEAIRRRRARESYRDATFRMRVKHRGKTHCFRVWKPWWMVQ